MYTKKKNEVSIITYEQSWMARLQRRLGWTRTWIIEVDASPSQCLSWIKEWPEQPNTGFNISVETQSIKYPYQFKIHIVTREYRPKDMGLIIGVIKENQTRESGSEVTLCLYMYNHYLYFIIFETFFAMLLGFNVLTSQDPINKNQIFCLSFGSLLVTAVCLVLMIGIAILFLLGGDEGLYIIKKYFSRLNINAEK